MAKRPVFRVINSSPYVEEVLTEFQYYPGFALSQAQKSVRSLHESYILNYLGSKERILEISSKSTEELGIGLSAFNLQYTLKTGEKRPLESVFQSSKYFQDHMQFEDLLFRSAYDAKKDNRLHEHGVVVKFVLEGETFPTEPVTMFYDWIYIRALEQSSMKDEIMNYDAFTDIAFNPAKSMNCQARTAAKYVGMKRMGILHRALRSPQDFRALAYGNACCSKNVEGDDQISIFDIL